MTPPAPLSYTPQHLGPGTIEFNDATVRHVDSIVILSSGVLQSDTDEQRVLYSPFFWKRHLQQRGKNLVEQYLPQRAGQLVSRSIAAVWWSRSGLRAQEKD